MSQNTFDELTDFNPNEEDILDKVKHHISLVAKGNSSFSIPPHKDDTDMILKRLSSGFRFYQNKSIMCENMVNNMNPLSSKEREDFTERLKSAHVVINEQGKTILDQTEKIKKLEEKLEKCELFIDTVSKHGLVKYLKEALEYIEGSKSKKFLTTRHELEERRLRKESFINSLKEIVK